MESIDIKKLSNDNILELFQVLTSANLPDQNKLNKASEIIEKYKTIPESLDGCLYQLSTNTDEKLRQFTALILYKSVDYNWEKISEEKKEEIKKKVLELYSKEKVYIVLKGIGYVIFKICKKTLNANKWDNLLDMIFSSPDKYSQGQEHLFEINLHIIADLVGSVNNLLKDNIK